MCVDKGEISSPSAGMITGPALDSLPKEPYTFTLYLEQRFHSVFPYSGQNHWFWLAPQHFYF